MRSAYSFQVLELVVVATSYAYLGYDNRLTSKF